MTLKGTVIEAGKLALENGAKVRFDAGDCAEPLKPGDRVIVETATSPSIRKASKFDVYTPVRETKVIAAEATKAFEALVAAHGDDL